MHWQAGAAHRDQSPVRHQEDRLGRRGRHHAARLPAGRHPHQVLRRQEMRPRPARMVHRHSHQADHRLRAAEIRRGIEEAFDRLAGLIER